MVYRLIFGLENVKGIPTVKWQTEVNVEVLRIEARSHEREAAMSKLPGDERKAAVARAKFRKH